MHRKPLTSLWLAALSATALITGACSESPDPAPANEPSASSPSPTLEGSSTPTAEPAVRLTFVKKRAGVSCASTCYWVDIEASGFAPSSTQSLDLTFNGSDWCGGSPGCQNPRKFRVDNAGHGGIHHYFYISSTLRGTVRAAVGGVTDTKKVP